MPRNLERLSMDQKPQNVDAPHTPTVEFVAPTEFIELPSRGVFYGEGHPLHNADTLEIKEMTAKEEDILTNRSLIKKGVVFDRLMSSVLIDKSIPPQGLLVGDRNAIIMGARIGGYGADYQTKVTCPMCLSHSKKTYDLAEIEANDWEREMEDASVVLSDGLFEITLPRLQKKVKARPLNGHDEKALVSLGDADAVTGQLKRFIVEVDGEQDKGFISRFISNMPARDAKYLRTLYKKITPNLNFEKEFECDKCGYDTKLEVRLTPDFFWFE